MHVVFGVDDKGFFIEASAAGEPLVSVENVRISGNVQGTGKFGFLEVTVEDATLTVDPDVRINVQLTEPGADPHTGVTDGLIRLYELRSVSELFDVTVTGDPAVDDVVLNVTAEVAALLPGGIPPFTSGQCAGDRAMGRRDGPGNADRYGQRRSWAGAVEFPGSNDDADRQRDQQPGGVHQSDRGHRLDGGEDPAGG